MKFHLYHYAKRDSFKFLVNDLNNPVQDFSTDKENNTGITVKL